MVQPQRIGAFGLERDEAHALVAVEHDVVHERHDEAGRQPLARARGVEAPHALQARAHRVDAQRQHGLEIAGVHRLQRQPRQEIAHVDALVQAATAARICSSTSLALAGMGVPGP
jgi:hypothetical protein